MSEFFGPSDSYYEEPPEACPECGGVSRHSSDCEIGYELRVDEFEDMAEAESSWWQNVGESLLNFPDEDLFS